MAIVFYNQGQYEKALEWYGRALDGKEKTLGKDHPSTLDTVHNMAGVFYNQGQYEKALEWYGRALDGYEKTLGKDHPSTLQTLRCFNDAQSQLRGKTPSGP
jgi:tetratricopeptide (TPR) repeat protein